MALKTHPERTEGVYEDNLPRVAGVKVELKKKKIYFLFLKIYEDQLGSKLEQQLFPGNGARELVGYFNGAN